MENTLQAIMSWFAEAHRKAEGPPDLGFSLFFSGELSLKKLSNMDNVKLRFIPAVGKKLSVQSKLIYGRGANQCIIEVTMNLPERATLTDVVIGRPTTKDRGLIECSRGTWVLQKGDQPASPEILIGNVLCNGALILFHDLAKREWLLERNN